MNSLAIHLSKNKVRFLHNFLSEINIKMAPIKKLSLDKYCGNERPPCYIEDTEKTTLSYEVSTTTEIENIESTTFIPDLDVDQDWDFWSVFGVSSMVILGLGLMVYIVYKFELVQKIQECFHSTPRLPEATVTLSLNKPPTVVFTLPPISEESTNPEPEENQIFPA